MNQTNTVSAPRTKTYEITMTALMAAVTCILAPLSIPIGPVPISFTNLAIYLSLYLLGWKKGTISYLIYLLLGLVGLPVFSGFTGGPAKLAGPTGGYIIGFIVMAVIAGLVIDNCHKPLIQLVGMIAGTIVCYLFGTVWFCIVADSTFKAALGNFLLPLYRVSFFLSEFFLQFLDQFKIISVLHLRESLNDSSLAEYRMVCDRA